MKISIDYTPVKEAIKEFLETGKDRVEVENILPSVLEVILQDLDCYYDEDSLDFVDNQDLDESVYSLEFNYNTIRYRQSSTVHSGNTVLEKVVE